MSWLFRGAICALALIALAPRALAQDGKHGSTSNTATETIPTALTGKERLGPKWTDEQRLDNCRVPVDKRGSKPRPSVCPSTPPN